MTRIEQVHQYWNEHVDRQTGGAATKLNLGCGPMVRPSYFNLDIAALPGVDCVADLRRGIPFSAGSVHLALCKDVLEHLPAVAFLREVHRVLAPGGIVIIQSVHFTSRNLYADPTHVRGFSCRTFDFFTKGSRRGYYFDFAFSQLESISIQFRNSRYMPWNRFLEKFVNRSGRTQDLYEMTGLSGLFPAENVIAVLRK